MVLYYKSSPQTKKKKYKKTRYSVASSLPSSERRGRPRERSFRARPAPRSRALRLQVARPAQADRAQLEPAPGRRCAQGTADAAAMMVVMATVMVMLMVMVMVDEYDDDDWLTIVRRRKPMFAGLSVVLY